MMPACWKTNDSTFELFESGLVHMAKLVDPKENNRPVARCGHWPHSHRAAKSDHKFSPFNVDRRTSFALQNS
jgi:hypothetical protein